MAKKQSFADKASKKAHGVKCPVCSEMKKFVRHVKAVRSEETGAWRLRSSNVGVCKCNHAEVYI